MKISVQQGTIQDFPADTIIVNLFEGVETPQGATGAVDEASNGAISRLIATGDLKGKLGEVRTLYSLDNITAQRVLITGLGKPDSIDQDNVRKAAAVAMKLAQELNAKDVATIVHGAGMGHLHSEDAAQSLVEGSILALYQYEAQKQKIELTNEIQSLSIVEYDAGKIGEINAGVKAGEAIAAGVLLARDLVNMPPNVATPTRMATEAKAIAKAFGMKITIGGRRWAAKRDMGAFLAVAKGAGEKPKFIVMEHNCDREDLDTIVLVGKGITFDTGGISLKPSERMGLMKSDMGGAAAVLGAMKAVGAMQIPLRVIAITPCTENMPDADAYHPADVIKASNGKTIEIISTDAEGRMVLADGLVFAKKYGPKAVIDLATLTGACVIALGAGMAAGLFSTEESIKEKLLAASNDTSERIWPLPLWDDYKKAIKSDVADMKNSGGRFGGVATSAIFLKEFTNYPWAHLDIAGMALSEKAKDYTTVGGTGYGVRLLLSFLRNW